MNIPTKQEFEALRKAVDQCIHDAGNHPNKDGDGWCVNWGDLHCGEIHWSVPEDWEDDAEPQWSIQIEEASPDGNWKFKEFIHGALEKAWCSNSI